MPIRLRPLLKPSHTLGICLDCMYNAWNDEFIWIHAADPGDIRALHWWEAREPSQIYLKIRSPAPRSPLVRVFISVPRAYRAYPASATIHCIQVIIRYNLPSLIAVPLYTKRGVRGRVSRGENGYDCSNSERVTFSSHADQGCLLARPRK